MEKAKITLANDVLLLVAFLVAGITGIVKFWIYPWSSELPTFLGMSKPLWAGIHDWSGVAMVVLTLSHIVLYWDMMKANLHNCLDKGEECTIGGNK